MEVFFFDFFVCLFCFLLFLQSHPPNTKAYRKNGTHNDNTALLSSLNLSPEQKIALSHWNHNQQLIEKILCRFDSRASQMTPWDSEWAGGTVWIYYYYYYYFILFYFIYFILFYFILFYFGIKNIRFFIYPFYYRKVQISEFQKNFIWMFEKSTWPKN